MEELRSLLLLLLLMRVLRRVTDMTEWGTEADGSHRLSKVSRGYRASMSP